MCVCESTYAVLLSDALVFLNSGLVQVLFLGSFDSSIAMIMCTCNAGFQNCKISTKNSDTKGCLPFEASIQRVSLYSWW
jgi:hypothetical protein